MNMNTKEPSIESKSIISADQMNSFDITKIKEFNDKSVEMIFDDKIENGLEILKKIESFLESNAIENKSIFDKKILIIILHNLACCYQKSKDYKNCISYLEAVIYHFDGLLEQKHGININCDYFFGTISDNQMNNNQLGDVILELRFSAKFHLQMCAVLSQAGEHERALTHAKLSSLMCEDNIVKTYFLFKQMGAINNKEDQDYPKYEEKIKQSEGIIQALYERVLHLRQKHKKDCLNYNDYFTYRTKEIIQYNYSEKLKETIRKIYGVIQKDDWIQMLNIGTIMYLSAFTYDDLDLDSDPKYELLRDAILEKTVMLTVSYFCIATEMRLLKLNNMSLNGSFWHRKAVEFSSNFLPVSCPIIRHYISSFDKHYGSSLQSIPENDIFNSRINLIRSEIEIDKDPMIFASCSKVTINKLKKVVSRDHNDYDLINNKFVASMTKIKDDKAPKFKLNFFNIKKDSCENINKSTHSDNIMKERPKTDRIKINKIFTKNCPIYNTSTNQIKKYTDSKEKKNHISRDKKLEVPCHTHREFNVRKKELLIKTSNSTKGHPTTTRIFSKTKENSKRNIKLKNGSNQVTITANTINTSSKPKIKDSGIYLIDKLLSDKKSRIQGSNISYNSTNSSLNSLLKSFQLPRKSHNY